MKNIIVSTIILYDIFSAQSPQSCSCKTMSIQINPKGRIIMQNILIVEDSPSINLMYRKIFTQANGWISSFSTSFKEAIGMVSDKTFDYVISDGLLDNEEMTGIEFLSKVKSLSPVTTRLLNSGSLFPRNDDYLSFNAFINKKDLEGQDLLETINSLAKEDSALSDKFYYNVFLS